MLKGDRVKLREVRKSDSALFLKWFNDLEISQNMGAYLPFSDFMQEQRMREAAERHDDSNVFFMVEITENESPKTIGQCGLHRINQKDRCAYLGLAIGEKSYWRKSYGFESANLIICYAFRQMNLNRITSHVFGFNKPSLALHKKIGFVQECIYRQDYFKDGRYWDTYCFGLLREEWQKNAEG